MNVFRNKSYCYRRTKYLTLGVMAQVVLGREIENRFPDFDGSKLVYDPQTQKLKPDVETTVYENACKLLRILERELSSGADQNASVYTGTSGIALLYLHLMDVSLFKDKGVLLGNGLRHVEKVLPYLSKKRYTFLCGDTGPLAVGAVLYHRINTEEKKNDLIKRIEKFSRRVSAVDPNEYNELLYGRAGYLFTLLFMRKYLGESSVRDERVKEVVSAIIHAGKTHSHKIRHKSPLYYEWHDKAYVGSAHGFAGILYMLLQAKDFLTDDEMNQVVKPSVDYVFSLKFPSGNFPSSLGNNTDKLIHWCHGASGVIHLMLLAYEVFGDLKYLTAAKECGEVIWERGLLKKGYGICHGVAGNGYGFLRLFQVTKDEKYLYRAIKFAEWCFDYGKHNCNIPDHPLSLFEGIAGTVYFLCDLLDPMHAAFPAFQLF